MPTAISGLRGLHESTILPGLLWWLHRHEEGKLASHLTLTVDRVLTVPELRNRTRQGASGENAILHQD